MSRPALQTPSGAVADSLDRRFHRTARLHAALTPTLVAIAALAWAVVRGIDHRFISFSDGVYMYAASTAAAHGLHALYNDVALSLPPATLIAATFVWKVSPSVESMRLVLAAATAVTAVLTFRAARELFGLGRRAAFVAAFLGLTAPVQAQFVGLDGEMLLIPLVLALALALERRRVLVVTALLALGWLVKLTWAPFFLAGLVVVAWRGSFRRAAAVGVGALVVAAVLYAGLMAAFGWQTGELARQLVLAEGRSGYQPELFPVLTQALALMWWPALPLAPAGLRRATSAARWLALAGVASSLFMLKEGTFFNVMAPLEPLLAVAAVAGAILLWARRPALVALCAVGAALHVASVTRAPVADALPLPVGAAIVETDNEASVDRLARAIEAHSRPDQPVLVSPYFAVVAGRREPLQAADWFILRSLERYCGGRSVLHHCRDWRRVKEQAARGNAAVIGVDTNVVRFDPHFREDTRAPRNELVARVDQPPIRMTLYAAR
jgi:hypothetical protein